MEHSIKIKYYVDFINSINDRISENEIRLMEYEKLVIKEKIILARLSFFSRLFSGSKKLIKELNESISAIQKTIDDHKLELNKKRTEMINVGVDMLEQEDKKMHNTYLEHDLYFKISRNLESLTNILIKSFDSLKNSNKNYYVAKDYDDKQLTHLSAPMYVKSLDYLLSSINEVKSFHQLIHLKDYIGCDTYKSEFRDNFRIAVESLIAHEKKILNVRTDHRTETLRRDIADSRVLKTRMEFITSTETILKSLLNMIANEKVIFDERFKTYGNTIDIFNSSRKSFVLAKIREEYGLKDF